MAIGWPARESKDFIVKRAAAQVPEILAGGQIEPVDVAAQIERFAGLSMTWAKVSVLFIRL